MSDAPLKLSLETSDAGAPIATLGGRRVGSLAELNELGLDLADADVLLVYIQAANHLAHAGDYQLIRDPAAYRAGYEARWDAEDPNAPFTEGAPRLHDFGRSDTASIDVPRLQGDHVVAFFEDDYLRIPYRAAFPIDAASAEEASYKPLDIVPT